MATMKDHINRTGKTMSNTARSVGEKVLDGAEAAIDKVREMTGTNKPVEGSNLGVGAIREHRPVIASCGKQVGSTLRKTDRLRLAI